MRLLCIAANHEPYGHVPQSVRPDFTSWMSAIIGQPAADLEILLSELEQNAVFSRDKTGRIYSRRLVRDEKMSRLNQKNGKKGGNVTLCNIRGKSQGVNPPLKPPDKPHYIPISPNPKESTDLHFAPATPIADDFVLPDWVPKVEWDGYLQKRLTLAGCDNSKITLNAMVSTLQMLQMRGSDIAQVLRNAIQGNWKTLHMENQSKQPSGGTYDKRSPAKFNPATAAIEYANRLAAEAASEARSHPNPIGDLDVQAHSERHYGAAG